MLGVVCLPMVLSSQTYTTYYDSGNIKDIGSLENGKIHGISKGYYEDGTLMYVEKYRRDRQVGEAFYYDENGHLKASAKSRKNHLKGKAKLFYKNVQVRVVEKNNDGIQNGNIILYSPNGDLKRLEYWRKGKKFGNTLAAY